MTLNESPCARGILPHTLIEALHSEPSNMRTPTIRLSSGKRVHEAVNLFPLEIPAKTDAVTAMAATVISTIHRSYETFTNSGNSELYSITVQPSYGDKNKRLRMKIEMSGSYQLFPNHSEDVQLNFPPIQCSATANYELDEGYVLSGDDMNFDCSLANVTACNASIGKCMADGRIDKKILVEQCACYRVGTCLAPVTEKRIIVGKLQASFVPLDALSESRTQAERCQFQSFAPMQNGILITFDGWKAQDFKLHLNKYVKTQCQTRNNFLILIRCISRSDPSMAAKLFLYRGDVSAVREGDEPIVFLHNGIIERSSEETHGGETKNEVAFWSAILQDISIQQAQAQIDLLKSRSARWGLRAKPSTFFDSRKVL
uniref:Phlebovirus glycoprotein G2 fusion domain-containing protein n=1 Tax=Parascaris equorum TaxID=6256 RepID=A0A914RUR9_PAREQ